MECSRKWNLAKRKLGKAKTKVACGDNTQSWNQAETMRSKGKCIYDLEWDRNFAYEQCLVSYCLWKMTPGKNVNSPWKVLEFWFPISVRTMSHHFQLTATFCNRLGFMCRRSWLCFAGEGEKQTIIDQTETNLVALRRTIYLTIQSSLDFEECAHKLMKMELKPGQEVGMATLYYS